MRRLVLAVTISLFSALVIGSGVSAAHVGRPSTSGVHAQQQQVDDNDDTRVEVQLIVLGIAIGTVFVAGTGIYLLRRKLGLVAPPPEPGSDGHH
jgi:hypothetical protein